jgi:hypothetical protein
MAECKVDASSASGGPACGARCHCNRRRHGFLYIEGAVIYMPKSAQPERCPRYIEIYSSYSWFVVSVLRLL